jgi:hypothetical protein
MGNARLEPVDVAALTSALAPLITLPENETWANVLALNVHVQPDGFAILNVRFKQ